MSIFIHNTLSGKKEEFSPLVHGKVGMYHCGPTVYDSAHIGNFRTFVTNDIIRRVFEYNKFDVTQVMNITDVDDKTIRRAQTEKTTLAELTRRYESLFMEDIQSLNILTPHHLLRARENVESMIDMISVLIEKGFAYPSKDGIYFSIGKSQGYGKLAGLKPEDNTKSALEAGLKERISNDEYEKENPRDFALWKFYTPNDGHEDGGAVWDAPFGKGRPGWHIECSAMSTKVLGETIDIHTGGADLVFPHHTNEIAQSEGASDKIFAKYWIHTAFMNVNDDKMSKSSKNFLKLADLEAMMLSPLAFRYWLLTSHYHSPVNFSSEAVKGAQTAFIRLIEIFVGLDTGESKGKIDTIYREKFTTFVNNDFDMPKALALVWELVKDKVVSPADKKATLLDFDKVFGLGLDELKSVDGVKKNLNEKDIPAEILALAEARYEARVAKEWEKADALRAEIDERGYSIEDTSDTSKKYLIGEK